MRLTTLAAGVTAAGTRVTLRLKLAELAGCLGASERVEATGVLEVSGALDARASVGVLGVMEMTKSALFAAG